MNAYALAARARDIANHRHRELGYARLGAPTRQLLLTLADELELAVTKLRDKDWDREWARKRQAQAAKK